jgi:hypothetical protein
MATIEIQGTLLYSGKRRYKGLFQDFRQLWFIG